MSRLRHLSSTLLLLCALVLTMGSTSALAQDASLHGQVTDQNGAIVPGAKVTVRGSSGLVKTAHTDDSGSYSFANLPAGDYTVEASAPSLTVQEPLKITLGSGSKSWIFS